MFYRPEDGHGLPHNPFSAIVAPRPVGWIATRCSTGDNLAPYSFFNAVAYTPPQVMFSSLADKDSLKAIRETGVFCVNICGRALAEAMNLSSGSYPRGTDEFTLAGLEKAPCRTIDCPRVAAAPAALECRMTQVIQLAGKANFLVLGTVTGVHIDDAALTDGRLDVTRYQPVARLGYDDFCAVDRLFQMVRPG